MYNRVINIDFTRISHIKHYLICIRSFYTINFNTIFIDSESTLIFFIIRQFLSTCTIQLISLSTSNLPNQVTVYVIIFQTTNEKMETCCIAQTSCIECKFNTTLSCFSRSNTQISNITLSNNTILRLIYIII